MKTTTFFLLLFIFFLNSATKAQDTVYLKNAERIFCKVTEVGNDQIKYKKLNFPDGPDYLVPKISVIKIVYSNGSSDLFREDKRNDSIAVNVEANNNPIVKPAMDSVFRKNNINEVGKITGADIFHIKMKKENNSNQPAVLIMRTGISKIRYANGTVEIFNSLAKFPMVDDSMFTKGVKDAAKYYVHPGGRKFTIFATLFTGFGGAVSAIVCSSFKPKLTNLGCPDKNLMKNENYMRGYTYKAKKMKKKRVWGGFGITVLCLASVGMIASIPWQ